MYQAIAVIELKSIARGIEAADAALKRAGVRLVSSHASCPGKYEIILTGVISDVTAATEVVRERFDDRMIDSCVIGMNDQQKMEEYFGIPHGSEVRLILALGYAADTTPANKIRKPLDEVCSFNKW